MHTIPFQNRTQTDDTILRHVNNKSVSICVCVCVCLYRCDAQNIGAPYIKLMVFMFDQFSQSYLAQFYDTYNNAILFPSPQSQFYQFTVFFAHRMAHVNAMSQHTTIQYLCIEWVGMLCVVVLSTSSRLFRCQFFCLLQIEWDERLSTHYICIN